MQLNFYHPDPDLNPQASTAPSLAESTGILWGMQMPLDCLS